MEPLATSLVQAVLDDVAMAAARAKSVRQKNPLITKRKMGLKKEPGVEARAERLERTQGENRRTVRAIAAKSTVLNIRWMRETQGMGQRWSPRQGW
ncbi:MAG: hypothetical protein ACLQVL_11985, partial [Terriglobia bacterium]